MQCSQKCSSPPNWTRACQSSQRLAAQLMGLVPPLCALGLPPQGVEVFQQVFDPGLRPGLAMSSRSHVSLCEQQNHPKTTQFGGVGSGNPTRDLRLCQIYLPMRSRLLCLVAQSCPPPPPPRRPAVRRIRRSWFSSSSEEQAASTWAKSCLYSLWPLNSAFFAFSEHSQGGTRFQPPAG